MRTFEKKTDMNWDMIQGKWKPLKGATKVKKGELTGDEPDQIDGRKDIVSGKFQKKYGWTLDQADQDIDAYYRDK